MADFVYLLCAATSLGCAVLLFRGHRRSRVRLLLWSTLCFVGLTVNNVLLVLDYSVLPDLDLSVFRSPVAFVSLLVLVGGAVNAGGGRSP